MMKKKSVLLLAALAFMGFAIPAQAQTTLYIAGGASFPTGDFGEYANTGWMAAAGAVFGIGESGFGVGGEVFYGQNKHKSESSFFENEKTTPYGIMAIVDYTFGTDGGIRPYLFGGAGLLVHKFSGDGFDSESESGFGYQFGAGVAFPVGATNSIFAEGRYMGSSKMGEGDFAETTNFFAALAGFAFGL
jgi:opacity protein-like surface antigen